MSSIEKKFWRKLLQNTHEPLAQITPGFQLAVYLKGRLALETQWGKTFEYYDLASLTKILFTVSAIARGSGNGSLDIEENLGPLLGPYYEGLHPWQLLNHSAGLDWWQPYYQQINFLRPRSERWNQLRVLIEANPRGIPTHSVYSDLDFFVLAFWLMEKEQRDLLEVWNRWISLWSSSSFHFNVDNVPSFPLSKYAPTEDCPWRKKVLCGEVHDDNTWALGGVSTHAGLFGSLTDVVQWGLMFRRAFYGEGRTPFGDPEVLRKFATRSLTTAWGDWALGFMLPTRGSASCGKYFSPRSVGHTGFTGTSFWFDPRADLFVVLLSNRVHPTRSNQKFAKLRPLIHNTVVEVL